jgi:hypothetical protein
VFCALNRTLRGQRRRLVTLAAILALVGVVVSVHSVMSHDHMAGAIVTCLAVAETAIVAVGAALALSVWMRSPLRLVPAPSTPELAFVPSPAGIRARAGPPVLQVFRL